MTTANLTHTMYEGEYKEFSFTVTTTKGGSTAQDLTGWTIYFTVAQNGDNGPLRTNPKVSKDSTGVDVMVTDAVNGVVLVKLQAADTATLAAGGDTQYTFQLEGRDSSSLPAMLAEGTLTVKPNVQES